MFEFCFVLDCFSLLLHVCLTEVDIPERIILFTSTCLSYRDGHPREDNSLYFYIFVLQRWTSQRWLFSLLLHLCLTEMDIPERIILFTSTSLSYRDGHPREDYSIYFYIFVLQRWTSQRGLFSLLLHLCLTEMDIPERIILFTSTSLSYRDEHPREDYSLYFYIFVLQRWTSQRG